MLYVGKLKSYMRPDSSWNSRQPRRATTLMYVICGPLLRIKCQSGSIFPHDLP